MSGPDLSERLDALDGAVRLVEGRLPVDDVALAATVVARSRERLRHGTHHTVIALAGPTGAGKSTVFNALAGEQLSTIGVRRPTTSTTHAVVWGDVSAGLLDWLGVKQRHHLAATSELDGLVLLDLPDHDSTAEAHRVEVDRLVQLVDELIWVVDPQKYADHALHNGYLRPLADHGEVMSFVLSKADTLDAESLEICRGDLQARLVEDGIAAPEVLAVSVTTGQGLDNLRAVLAAEVQNRRAVADRVAADVAAAADRLSPDADAQRSDRTLSKAAERDLVRGLARAAGVDAVAERVERQHLRRARQSLDWPYLRWIRRLRRKSEPPLPTPGASAVASAEVSIALRNAGEEASANVSGPWRGAVRRTATDRAPDVSQALTGVAKQAVRPDRDTPRWWSFVGGVQKLLGLMALVGLVWLLGLLVVEGFFRLDADRFTPKLEWMPLPTLLLFAGAALGVLLALLARIPARIGARRRARRAAKDLDEQVAAIARREVIDLLDATLADRRELSQLLALAASK